MRRNHFMLTLLSAALLALTGCGGKDKKKASNSPQVKPPPPVAQNKQPAQKQVERVPMTGPQADAAKQRLVGEWYGEMEVNEQKVAETLRAKQKGQVDDRTIRSAIATLQSLKMNIHFRADGGMRLAAQLSDQGEAVQEASDYGKWELLQVKDNDVLIRSIEKDRVPEEVQVHFDGPDAFSMQPPKEYAGIGMMRFRRIRR